MKYMPALFLPLLVSVKIAYAGDPKPDMGIKQIASGIYLHTSFRVFEGFGRVASNGLLAVNNGNAYIIDTPASPEDTEVLVNWSRDRGFTVKGSISTHFHEDSSAGIEFLNSQSIPTYASGLTNELLGRAGSALASNSFSENSFWLEKDRIEVFYPGPGHSVDNVVIWLPGRNVLFGGCFIRAQQTKSLGNLGDAVVGAWAESADNLASRYPDARLVVPGHGKVGGASLLGHTRELATEAARAGTSKRTPAT